MMVHHEQNGIKLQHVALSSQQRINVNAFTQVGYTGHIVDDEQS
jgi:uncharacterized protein (DUF305 family)